jgi:hypothetical protein
MIHKDPMSGRKREDQSTIRGRQVGVRFSGDEHDLLMRLVERENEQLRGAGIIPAVTPTLLIRMLVSRYAVDVGLKEGSRPKKRRAQKMRAR